MTAETDETVVSKCPTCGQPASVPPSDPARTVLEPPPSDAGPVSSDERLPSDVREALGAPDRRLDRYVLLAELGRGGMGVVYRAYDLSLRRAVAIKMILDARHSDALTRFHREAAAVAKLRHPGIVAVHEAGVHEGKPYLVMDFIEGQSLESWLRVESPSPHRIAELVREVARALEHAHAAGIVHRDVKPENVLVDRSGKPHVADFGLARDTDSGTDLTRTGQVLGTPAYMAPEQAGGRAREHGPRTDVYALGAVLYRALSGQPPFPGDNVGAVIKRVLLEDARPLRRVNPKVHVDLETIAHRCLEKEPASRYARAGDVADELDRFVRGEPIKARPPWRFSLAWRFARRNPAFAAVLAVLIVAIVAAAVVVDERIEREKHYFRLVDRGHKRAKAEDYRNAIKDFTWAIELFPDKAEAWFDRGDARAKQGEFGQAIADYDRAIALLPAREDFVYARAQARANQGDFEGALADMDRVIAAAPEYAAYWHFRGRLRRHTRDFAGSIADQSQALAIVPSSAQTLTNRGFAKSDARDLDGAIADAEKALALDPKWYDGWLLRSRVRLQRGDLAGALADVNSAVRLGPRDGSTWMNRALVRARRGERRSAQADLDVAASMGIPGDLIAFVASEIAAIKTAR